MNWTDVMNTPISADDFVTAWTFHIRNLAPTFAYNLRNEKLTFVEWIKYWVAWMELEDEQHIEEYYSWMKSDEHPEE